MNFSQFSKLNRFFFHIQKHTFCRAKTSVTLERLRSLTARKLYLSQFHVEAAAFRFSLLSLLSSLFFGVFVIFWFVIPIVLRRCCCILYWHVKCESLLSLFVFIRIKFNTSTTKNMALLVLFARLGWKLGEKSPVFYLQISLKPSLFKSYKAWRRCI